jgi:hypothetical protein
MSGARILSSAEGGTVAFWCPACDRAHQAGIAPPAAMLLKYNGNAQDPTFRPSIWIESDNPNGSKGGPATICHSMVTEGNIEFLSDSTHALAGQTVELPEWPA